MTTPTTARAFVFRDGPPRMDPLAGGSTVYFNVGTRAVARATISALQPSTVSRATATALVTAGTSSTQTGRLKFGVSAGAGTAADVTYQLTATHAASFMIYNTSSQPLWGGRAGVDKSDVYRDTIPDSADVLISVDCNNTAKLDELMASCPQTRTGKVYWCYRQEPENNKLADGSLEYPDPSVYRAEGALLYAAIDRARAAGKTYMVKSSCLLPDHGFMATDATHPAPLGHQQDWLIDGVEHIGWSLYAAAKAKGTPLHMVAVHDAYTFAKKAADCAARLGLPWAANATGFAVPTDYLTDPVSIQNRVDWFNSFSGNLDSMGATHFNWFNVYWKTPTFEGDYRVETDPALYAAWQTKLRDSGQYTGVWPGPTTPAAPVLTVTPVAGQAALSWTAPNDNGHPITGYTVQRKRGTGSFATLVSQTGLTYTDATAADGDQYRVSATNSTGTSAWSTTATYLLPTPAGNIVFGAGGGTATDDLINTQINTWHAKCFLIYWNEGDSHRWTDRTDVPPASSDILLSIGIYNAGAIDDMLASFPATRTGKVYLHYHQEPEDNMAAIFGGTPNHITDQQLYSGAQTYKARAGVLYDRIDAMRASGTPRSYIRKTVELQPFYQYKKTNSFTDAAGVVHNYPGPQGWLKEWVPAGCEMISFSFFAHVQGNPPVALNDPANLAIKAGDACSAMGIPWTVAAADYGVDVSDLANSSIVQAHHDWFDTNWRTSMAHGARHYPWWNVPNADGTGKTYYIGDVPGFPAIWTAALREVGQIT